MRTIVMAAKAALLLMFPGITVAGTQADNQAFIAQQQATQQLLKQLNTPLHIGPNSQAVDQDWIDQLARKRQQDAIDQSKRERKTPTAIYFVSASIPEQDMREILREADRLGVPAVMRGLVNNDFRSSAAYMLKLSQPDNIGGVQVDPNLFKQFDIKAVPALVVHCATGYDKVLGAKPEKALQMIAEHGDCQHEAQELSRGDS